MGTRFDAEPYLRGLTGFQRSTVNHVTDRLYGTNPTRRFLVADETGLGKSLVARGVIARTVERLQDDPTVERIDVVYVCSNSDLARQNIGRLDVTGEPELHMASRLTLLARHSRQFLSRGQQFGKPVNLVSFTPGTSFDMGWQSGKAEERALLYLLLRDALNLTGAWDTTARRLLQGQVGSLERFTRTIDCLDRELDGQVDPAIANAFLHATEASGSRGEFTALVDEMGRRRTVPAHLTDRVRKLTGRLRGELARASVDTLTPDLVILDEFQRFRHLLDLEGQRGGSREAAELAHSLFDHGQARVLLLSATPYKPFTYAEEAAGGDDHHSDFVTTLRFLAEGCDGVSVESIATDLAAYRRSAVRGEQRAEVTTRLRAQLLRVMCRSERPDIHGAGMIAEQPSPVHDVRAEDLLGYVNLRRVAEAVEGQFTLDYWKSAPYFVNFMDGYQLAHKIRAELDADPGEDSSADRLTEMLANAQRLEAVPLRGFSSVDFGNARMRALAAETVEAGWWKLLWLPPSLPYLAPGGAYAEEFAQDVTKRLVFSSWAATPTAIAALLSYEAERRTAEGSRLTTNTPATRRQIAQRLTYRVDSDHRPQAMTTLALFWPNPSLARLTDPLAHARRHQDGPPTARKVLAAAAADVTTSLPTEGRTPSGGPESWYWAAPLRIPGALPQPAERAGQEIPGAQGEFVADLVAALGGTTHDDEQPSDPTGLEAHVELALCTGSEDAGSADQPTDLAEVAAAIGLHGPGNIAWRALGRLLNEETKVTSLGHWRAAAKLASGLRSLFSRLETTLLLDLQADGEPYWRSVLRYCAEGNLQAVLDEHLHHLALAEGILEFDDDKLGQLADAAARGIALRPSRYTGFDPEHPRESLPFTCRFALRYGGRRQDEESSRQPEVRRAFNSPFWPFVLATTSVGQEGIDFHWWSHAVFHWNTPTNPVDFEQREGRVYRYAGHAVRRNIAARHRDDILASGDRDPWRAAYLVATDETDRLADFSPYWVYPGPAKILRIVAPYPMSIDSERFTRLKDDLALYRLTFGQPRQEDMLDLLRHHGITGSWGEGTTSLNLRPDPRH